ncbi:hypothetical protein [Kordiimonas pumila]|uniref:ABC transporter permease n=1 Tax=Kordiimonas pumila TaxID=2161677 RepID=A0ABV7D957_9PROT|nr:hypothetical protein [Kordiimonas pumila]
MRSVPALIKREILESKNSFVLTPLILAGIAITLVSLTLLGFGNMQFIDGMQENGVQTFSDLIVQMQKHRPDDWREAMMVGYWVVTMPVWAVMPFVIFFGLLGSLYEERRDRSILFWKSMPVPDWQEVLVKLAVPLLVVPLIFLMIAILAQIIIATLFTVVLAVQGGDIGAVWPFGLMLKVWFSSVGANLLFALWGLPLTAWVLFVSSFAARMPFMWAVLPPALIVIVEGMFSNTAMFGKWLAIHAGAWLGETIDQYAGHQMINGPREVLIKLTGGPFFEMLAQSMINVQFWFGLIIAAGFVYGAVYMRKQAL